MKLTRQMLREIIFEQLTLNLRNKTDWERWVSENDSDDHIDESDNEQ